MSLPQFHPTPVRLTHRRDGDVEALIRAACAADFQRWREQWLPTYRELIEGTWPWEAHIDRAIAEPMKGLCVAIVRGHTLDALMSLSYERGGTNSGPPSGSRFAPGEDIVYVEYVGIAPQHLKPPIGTRDIAGLGQVLVGSVATALSLETRADGRLGLHSKDDASFLYRKLEMVEGGYENTEDGKWLYFEGGPEWARRRVGLSGKEVEP